MQTEFLLFGLLLKRSYMISERMMNCKMKSEHDQCLICDNDGDDDEFKLMAEQVF